MKSNAIASVVVLSAVCSSWAAQVLPFGREQASSEAFAAIRLQAMDDAAERGWLAIGSRAEYDSARTAMRAKMLEAMGTFPERTPLNPVVRAAYERDGYRIEKVVFWSMPGVPVTANVFSPAAPGRHPAVVMSCGHSVDAKDAPRYLRACVIAAKRGFVALMFDPYEQGERQTGEPYISTRHHNQIGLLGSLMDWSMPLLRVWDGMRAIDYVASRMDVDPSRIGYMGQSGGGTLTALMEAADPRIRAAAPSCYLTRLGELCATIGPQDAEQNIFGQLAFGLNHTGLVLIPDIPVAVTCKTGDMFDYRGTLALFDTVTRVEKALGVAGRSFLNSAAGPHGWTETTETSSVEFLAKHLIEGGRGPDPDMESLRMLDLGFNIKQAEVGLSQEERGCLASRRVTELEGYRSIYAILAERAGKFESARAELSKDKLRAKAVELAGVRSPLPRVTPTGEKEWKMELANVRQPGVTQVRVKEWDKSVVVMYPDGEMLPCELAGEDGTPPVLVVDSRGRDKGRETAAKYIAKGRVVLIADIAGIGEVGFSKKTFYGAERADEELGAMQYLMGEPLVGRRATDILVLGQWLGYRFGVVPQLVAEGPLAIPAAHAFAAGTNAWMGVEIVNRPPSWKEVIESGIAIRMHYADLVPRAYLHYDWPDLLP